MRLLLLLLLLPALAFGQGLTTLAPGQTGGGKVLWQAPFATAGCYASGQTAGASSAISITRTTNGTYVDGSGNVQTCASGEFRVTTDGLLVEPAATSRTLNSDALSVGTAANTGWSLSGATVTTQNGAPIGTWAEITQTGLNGYIGQTQAQTGTVWYGCSWIAAASGTMKASIQMGGGAFAPSACACYRSDGTACVASVVATNYCQGYASSISTTPVRMCVVATGTSTAVALYLLPGEYGVTTNGVGRFGATDLVTGVAYPTSHITVVGTAVARNADAVSATVPSVPAKWCVAVTANTAWGKAEGALWAFNAGAPNYAFDQVYSDNVRYFYTYDGSSGVRHADLSAGLTPYTSHRFVACDPNSATLTIAMDGAVLSPTLVGAGTGQLTLSSVALKFGTIGSGTQPLGGYLKNLKIYSAKSTKEAK